VGGIQRGAHPSRVADELLSAAGQGDADALGAFYDRTVVVVFGLLRDVLGEPARAEQATLRVYLQLWRTAPRFDPKHGSAYSLLACTAGRELIGPLREALTQNRACGCPKLRARLLSWRFVTGEAAA
jgi:DNA-directed RNA polymerase specialized sigma24 family protein